MAGKVSVISRVPGHEATHPSEEPAGEQIIADVIPRPATRVAAKVERKTMGERMAATVIRQNMWCPSQ